MKEELLQQEKQNRQIKSKKWIWIIFIISSIIIFIAALNLIVLFVNNKNGKKSKEDKEINSQPSEPILGEEELAEYDKLCLLLQLGAFPGKEANSFSPRAKPKEELRSNGVYVRTEINFGEQFPNSYLDIYYPALLKKIDLLIFIGMEVDIFSEIKI